MVINQNKTVRVNLPISLSWQRINISSDRTFSAYIVEKKIIDEAFAKKETFDLNTASIEIQRDTNLFTQTLMGDGRYSLILRNNNPEPINVKVEVTVSKSV